LINLVLPPTDSIGTIPLDQGLWKNPAFGFRVYNDSIARAHVTWVHMTWENVRKYCSQNIEGLEMWLQEIDKSSNNS
jgi:hypothetical protein